MKIMLLVPDGIGIRNYLYTRLLSQLKSHHLVLVHRLPAEILQQVSQLHEQPLEEIKMPALEEKKWLVFYRRVCNYARLFVHARRAGNRSISENWLLFSIAKGRYRWNHTLARVWGWAISILPGGLARAERRLTRLTQKTSLGQWAQNLLHHTRPNLVFCTHQRSVDGGYVMSAAQALNISTVTVIFSWDNLAKSRMTFRANHYLVWSRWMQNDLLRFYPEIQRNQIHITGTPQFEYYGDAAMVWSLAQFTRELGLPAGKQFVCFSGNEPSFPSDHLYLQDLLEALSQTSEMENLPFVIVRPSPNDHTQRFEEVVARYPHHAKVCRPLWRLFGERSWEGYYPIPADSLILTNLVQHCAAVINVGSTMGIDFAHGNKPALYIAYNHPACPWFDLIKGYEQEHFSTLRSRDAVVWVKSPHQWLPLLQQVLAAPDKVATQRLEWKAEVTDDISDASERIARLLPQLGG